VDSGIDLIGYNAPHLLFAHIPKIEQQTDDPTEAIIAMTHIDIAAPSFGIGTCWAGFVQMAVDAYGPLQAALEVPDGRIIKSAMMFGYSQFEVRSIPDAIQQILSGSKKESNGNKDNIRLCFNKGMFSCQISFTLPQA
jgi:hypothetical protein